MKRVLSVILSLCMLFSITAGIDFSVFAESCVISVGEVEVAPSATVTVDVNIENNPGILGALITLEYSDYLTLISASSGYAFSALTMTPPGKLASPCKFSWDGIELSGGDIKDGTILSLCFNVSENAPSGEKCNVNISYQSGNIVDNNLNSVNPTINNGYVTIISDTCVHKNIQTLNRVEPTCTSTGITEGKKCLECGEIIVAQTIVSELGHDWNDGVVTKAPTETATGIRTYSCKRSGCGATKTEVIPVLTHTHSYTSVVTAPTCTEQGYTTHTCSCGESYVDNYVSAKGHNYSNGACTICGCVMAYGEEDENGITIIEAGMPLNYVCHADGWHMISFRPKTSGYYSISITNKSCEENTAINIFDSEYNFLAYQSSNESKDNLIYQYFNSGELYYIDAEYWNLKSHDGESFTVNVEPHTTHTYATTKATTTKNGVVKCKDCGNVKSTIYYPKTITLSTTSYTYDGKVKKPSVTVKDSNGKTISSSNYTVSYASGRKNVGKYGVKITFKGNYSGSKTLYFTIKPKAATISSISAKSKGFTVKWKKLTTQTTGYQIQYSTSSKFSNAKTVTVSNNSTTSKTISKLKGKKKYYVRIRTYKSVSGTKYYSSWSKSKTITTKR